VTAPNSASPMMNAVPLVTLKTRLRKSSSGKIGSRALRLDEQERRKQQEAGRD
jgi:hypothetical protein